MPRSLTPLSRLDLPSPSEQPVPVPAVLPSPSPSRRVGFSALGAEDGGAAWRSPPERTSKYRVPKQSPDAAAAHIQRHERGRWVRKRMRRALDVLSFQAAAQWKREQRLLQIARRLEKHGSASSVFRPR